MDSRAKWKYHQHVHKFFYKAKLFERATLKQYVDERYEYFNAVQMKCVRDSTY